MFAPLTTGNGSRVIGYCKHDTRPPHPTADQTSASNPTTPLPHTPDIQLARSVKGNNKTTIRRDSLIRPRPAHQILISLREPLLLKSRSVGIRRSVQHIGGARPGTGKRCTASRNVIRVTGRTIGADAPLVDVLRKAPDSQVVAGAGSLDRSGAIASDFETDVPSAPPATMLSSTQVAGSAAPRWTCPMKPSVRAKVVDFPAGIVTGCLYGLETMVHLPSKTVMVWG